MVRSENRRCQAPMKDARNRLVGGQIGGLTGDKCNLWGMALWKQIFTIARRHQPASLYPSSAEAGDFR